MPTCPSGHPSDSDDFCDVCGLRIAGSGAPGPIPPPPPPPRPGGGYGFPPGPDAPPQLCPQCRTPREAMAAFCEECQFNFLTNMATTYTPVRPPGTPHPGAADPRPGTPPPFERVAPLSPPAPTGSFPGGPGDPDRGPASDLLDPFERSRPSQVNRPSERLDSQLPGGAPSFPPPGRPTGDDWFLQPPGGPERPGAFPPPGSPEPPGAFSPPAPGSPDRPGFPPIGGPDRPGFPPPGVPDLPGGFPPPGGTDTFPPRDPFPGADVPSPDGPPRPQTPQPRFPGPSVWTAVIAPDRSYFMSMMQRSGPEAAGLNLPAYAPEQRITLTGNQITIGRRRHATGESPDIDLSVPPEDPGVSHQHAVLVQQPDGGWAVVDQNSTNGTTLNGGEEPIQPYVPVPLNDGDRVHVGAWTTITISRL